MQDGALPGYYEGRRHGEVEFHQQDRYLWMASLTGEFRYTLCVVLMASRYHRCALHTFGLQV